MRWRAAPFIVIIVVFFKELIEMILVKDELGVRIMIVLKKGLESFLVLIGHSYRALIELFFRGHERRICFIK